jgi:hypothetical protein
MMTIDVDFKGQKLKFTKEKIIASFIGAANAKLDILNNMNTSSPRIIIDNIETACVTAVNHMGQLTTFNQLNDFNPANSINLLIQKQISSAL